MVRNIDLPECILFYGRESFRTEDYGFESLMNECQETDTAVVLLDDGEKSFQTPEIMKDKPFHVFPSQYPPPNPYDILHILESLTIQPKPFGGSAGFGQKLPDPPRAPLAARTVIVCQTREATQAGRAVGTRVLSLEDNDLADAVVDEIDFWLDDIATPGSFWLNPPSPRDDEGNKVDAEYLVEYYSQQRELVEPQFESDSLPAKEEVGGDEMDDDELQRILGDMAPLK